MLGLFKNRAVLAINDQRIVLHVGDQRQDNLRLLAANSETGILETKGKRVVLSLGDNDGIRTGLPVSTEHEAQLISSGGLYAITGAINGQLAEFVVDTGAGYVTMSQQQAHFLHLDFSKAKKCDDEYGEW